MGGQKNWAEEGAQFVERHATFRRAVIVLSSILAPAALGALALPDKLNISADWAFGAVVSITVIAIFLGSILALSERSSGDLLATIARQQGDAEKAADRFRGMELELKKASKEGDRLAGLAALQDGLLVVINAVFELNFENDPAEHDAVIFALLQEAAAVGSRVFGWEASERWSLAVFLWNADTQQLHCVSDVRNFSSDHGEGHRSWHRNQGMVGVTYAFGEELVVSDAHSSELQTIMRDPDEARAAEDRDLYRSVAAVPIYRPPANYDADGGPPETDGLFGVVVATSDRGSRFTPDGDNELAPLRSIADVIETLLIGDCFVKTVDTESDDASEQAG